MIKMEQISKKYVNGMNQIEVLKGISLHIKKGEFVAIMGPSGCGKSTLLNIMGGMSRQTRGEYYYDETCVNQLSEKKLADFRNKYIGYVFQGFHLANELTVAENIALPLGYAGVCGKERKKRVKVLLDKVGLSEKYRLHPAKLSGGEKQRVALARALANRPRIILADEPTGNLDTNNGHNVMKILHELNQEGVTIVMVTHDYNLASMTDRQICMADGNIIN